MPWYSLYNSSAKRRNNINNNNLILPSIKRNNNIISFKNKYKIKKKDKDKIIVEKVKKVEGVEEIPMMKKLMK